MKIHRGRADRETDHVVFCLRQTALAGAERARGMGATAECRPSRWRAADQQIGTGWGDRGAGARHTRAPQASDVTAENLPKFSHGQSLYRNSATELGAEIYILYS